jgi:hypothetical protein
MGLPNLAINLGTQFVFDVWLHWSGLYALLAYLIGLGLSIEWSILFAMFTKSNFKLGRWKYRYNA